MWDGNLARPRLVRQHRCPPLHTHSPGGWDAPPAFCSPPAMIKSVKFECPHGGMTWTEAPLSACGCGWTWQLRGIQTDTAQLGVALLRYSTQNTHAGWTELQLCLCPGKSLHDAAALLRKSRHILRAIMMLTREEAGGRGYYLEGGRESETPPPCLSAPPTSTLRLGD